MKQTLPKAVERELKRIFEMMPSEKRFIEEEAASGGYEKIEAYQAIEKLIATQRRELVEAVEGMGKKKLMSPRSFGDGDIVDVSPGYNQAVKDFLTLLSSEGKEK